MWFRGMEVAPTENGNGRISWALNLDKAFPLWIQMKTMKNGQTQTSLSGRKWLVLNSCWLQPVFFSLSGGGRAAPWLAGHSGTG